VRVLLVLCDFLLMPAVAAAVCSPVDGVPHADEILTAISTVHHLKCDCSYCTCRLLAVVLAHWNFVVCTDCNVLSQASLSARP
jgi:hypothetical protein